MGRGQVRVIAVIGLVLLGIAVLVSSVQGGGFSTAMRVMALAGVGLLVIAAVLGLSAIVTLLRTRQGRYGMNVLTGTLVAFGIVLLVNLIGTRYFARADMTATNRFTLAPQTRNVLGELDRDVVMHVSVPSDNAGAVLFVNDLVSQYDEASSHLRAHAIDPARDPASVERLGIRGETWMVLESQGRFERLGAGEMSEEKITNALVRVTRSEKRKACVVTGHAERSLDDEGAAGLSKLRDALRQENYELGPVNLADAGGVPVDARVVLVLAPQRPLLPGDVAALSRYLDGGGHLLLLLDPVVADKALADLGVDSLLAVYGLHLGNGLVYDDSPFAKQSGLGRFKPVAGSPAGKHPITAGFSSVSVFPVSRRVWHEGGRGKASVLAATGGQSWEEMDITDATQVRFDNARDEQGPLVIAYAVEATAVAVQPLDPLVDPDRKLTPPETRLVVVGDADFAANANIGLSQLANRDLVLNAIAWLAQDEDLVAVRPRNPDERRLTLSAAKRNTIRVASTALIPMSVIVAGVLVWMRRRARDV